MIIELMQQMLTRPAVSVGLAVLDFGLVAVIVYQALLLIKGTRAAQALIGLLFLGVLFLAARLLGLLTINWILENFFGSFIIILVIVFQNDIRRGLSQMGRNPFSPTADVGLDDARVIDEIVRAVRHFSASRTGALIVVEREARLSDYTEEGHPLGARVSKELLEAIFNPSSPLHDGAVIVRDQVITHAKCSLPLSQNPKAARSLGMRHRAAVGLSELTDALVVVVSEESGTISIAHEGGLSRDIDPETVKEILQHIRLKRGSAGARGGRR